MTQKTNATVAQRLIEINRALPFADPIAAGPTYDEDHAEALRENDSHDWAWEMDKFTGGLFIDRDHEEAIVEDAQRVYRSVVNARGKFAGGLTGRMSELAGDNSYVLPNAVYERLMGTDRSVATLRAYKADGTHTDRPVTLGKLSVDRGGMWFSTSDWPVAT